VTVATITASVCSAMNEHGEPTLDQPRSPGPDKSDGMDQGIRVLSYLISGVLVYGFLGWLGDHYLGTRFLLPIGILLGAGFGVYVVIRRFGRVDDEVIAELSALHRKQAAGRPSAIGARRPATGGGASPTDTTTRTEEAR
jgi:F0F1-type ATP synthase assembly protein I